MDPHIDNGINYIDNVTSSPEATRAIVFVEIFRWNAPTLNLNSEYFITNPTENLVSVSIAVWETVSSAFHRFMKWILKAW